MKLLQFLVAGVLAMPIFPALAQSAAKPPVLQLPPPKPASTPAPAAATPRPPAPAPAVVPTLAPAGPKGVLAEVAPPRVRRAKPVAKPKRAPEPYADLPISEPAREALRRSDAWAGNETAIVAGGSDGRVVFVFGETMPTVVCAPLRMCVVELQAGEKVMGAPHVADPSRWTIAPGVVGEGEGRTVNVIVKPNEAGLDTNLLIPTNRRMYRLRLVSDESNYVSVISFEYPQDQRRAWDAALIAQESEEAEVVADLPPLSIDALDFNYGIKVTSGKPRWKPVRVFTDGHKTYIQLPAGTTAQDVPALVALSPQGDAQLVNFRLRGPYFVVDRVLQRGALLSGVGRHGERVEIERGCKDQSFFGKCKG